MGDLMFFPSAQKYSNLHTHAHHTEREKESRGWDECRRLQFGNTGHTHTDTQAHKHRHTNTDTEAPVLFPCVHDGARLVIAELGNAAIEQIDLVEKVDRCSPLIQ
jgi:hypothetical protein